jgi:hypothetical protein
MPSIIWNNVSNQTVNWAAISGPNLSQGPLASGQTTSMDRSGVDFAGWMPSGFTGLMVVTINNDPSSNVVVYATQPGQAEELISQLSTTDPGEKYE